MALYHILDTVQIPATMRWVDEYAWSQVASSSEYSIAGSLLVDVGTRLSGQPVTLEGTADTSWITRAALDALYALAAVPGATYTLTLADGRSFSTMFAPGEEPISAAQVSPLAVPPADWPYYATIRLMTIQQGNLKLLAAVVMDDADNNGGPPSSNVIPDGSSNTVFPDISELDRAGGRVQFRKIFPWVDEAATSTFYGANACLSDIPVDANTGCVLFEAASVSETQADVIARIGGVTGSLPAGFSSLISPEIYLRTSHSDPSQSYLFDVSDDLGAGFSGTIEVGTQLTVIEFSAGSVVKYETKTVETVDTVDLTHPGAYYAILGLSAGVHSSWSAVAAGSYWSDLVAPDAYGTYVIIGSGGASLSTDDFAYFGATLLTSGITSGATVLPVAATSQPVVPVDLIGTPDAATIIGFDPALLTKSPTGEEPILQAGRFVVIGKTISAAPTTVSNAQVINLGETGLSRVRVIGDNGNVITAGYTADLEAGTVTFDNVAGYSQPVTVTGRVEDMARVLSIAGLNVTISRAVTHDYPSGSTVSAAVIFGDLRARVGPADLA